MWEHASPSFAPHATGTWEVSVTETVLKGEASNY